MRTGQIGRTALAMIACAAMGAGPASAAGAAPRRHGGHRHAHSSRRHRRGGHAHSAHVLDGSETARLHLVRQRETHLYEQGAAHGVLGGRMSASLIVGNVFTGTFAIRTGHGTIYGRGSAKPHGTGRYQSFGGTLHVTGGSGRYRHIHGSMGLYGTFDRRTFAVVIKTHGRLRY